MRVGIRDGVEYFGATTPECSRLKGLMGNPGALYSPVHCQWAYELL